jgi:hypothetical protein
VLRRRCATLSQKHASVASTPGTRIDNALAQYEVSAGNAPHAAANQKLVWKRPPKSSRLYAATMNAPATMNGAIDQETLMTPTMPRPIAPASEIAAIAIRVRSPRRVPSGLPFSSSSACAQKPTPRKKAPSAAARRPPCSVGAAAAPMAT